VYPSDANFLLVKMNDPVSVYKKLLEQGIVVRDRSKVELCKGCLRITVGTVEENETLLYALAAIS
jgi:histidinol-phosphate aminotransferase